MAYQKVQSVSKKIHVKGPALKRLILDTMRVVSDIVGATLGPGGQPVLIERQEEGLIPNITKDGVTVFRSLGFTDPAQQCVMEMYRDASVRTATEAGDGTTTATILSEAFGRYLNAYCESHPKVSPQRVVRRLEELFRDVIEPGVKKLTRNVKLDTKKGKKLLHSVARVSANGDRALADAVMKCFAITGDEGNVTIVERNGASGYAVDPIQGFAIGSGYDQSCLKFYSAFVNDPGTQRCVLENPVFVLYHGSISEIGAVQLLLERIANAWSDKSQHFDHHNVVLVATGFSETVLASLALNFQTDGSINVFPLLAPLSQQSNGQLQFLQDLSAVTGAEILNPLSNPAERADLDVVGPGVELFEASRFRSNVIGYADEDLLLARIDELNAMLDNPESTLDGMLIKERKAKLAYGIAKLTVIGSSNGECKEKRDRAEDAVCAVRGALKHGVLPGGGWTLLKLCTLLPDDEVCNEIIKPALRTPYGRLVSNCGIVDEAETDSIFEQILLGIAAGKTVVYDFLEQRHVDAYDGGLLDSTPAVLEAIRNSISIASQLGTCGGIVVFQRDLELERSEARATASYLRDENYNPADERP